MSPVPPPGSAAPACPNCGAPVPDRYCPRCGQRYADRLPSVRRMAVEFFDDQFSLNGALPRTLALLFFRPGFLTREYVAGRIVRYVRPFRLFLISSVLFFVALTTVATADDLVELGETRGTGMPAMEQPAPGAAPRWENVGIDIDSTEVPPWTRPLLRRVEEQEERLNSLPPRAASAALLEALVDAFGRMVFLLVPGFALLLLLLHFRSRRRYVEHFVFALHFHAFAFLLLIPAILLGQGRHWAVVGLWLVVYLLMALRRAYEQPWWLAAGKLLVVGTVYLTVLSVAVGLAGMIAILLA